MRSEKSSAADECWAAPRGGCGDKISREHLVSQGLFPHLVDVQGLRWCKEAPKRVGIASLTQKFLCREHNSQLSDVDTEGQKLFRVIEEAAALGDQYRKVGT